MYIKLNKTNVARMYKSFTILLHNIILFLASNYPLRLFCLICLSFNYIKLHGVYH